MLNLKRSVVFSAVVLGMLMVGNASAKRGGKDKARNYEITLSSATKVGTVVLKAGDYKLKLDGENAIFTREASDTIFSTPGKLETVTGHFDKTIIRQVQDGDQSRIVSIELKGTQSLLKFD